MATVVSSDVGIPLSVERRDRNVRRLNLIEGSRADLRGTATSKVR
jgi:hypothetical protein